MFDGMDSEALLAIPFFLLVGELMSSANVVSRITNLSLALVGHIRGGLSQVVTVFSMFSRRCPVDDRRRGGDQSCTRQSDEKEGRTPAFTAAIIAAASTIAAWCHPASRAVVWPWGTSRLPACSWGCAGLRDRLRADVVLLFLRPRGHGARALHFATSHTPSGCVAAADDPDHSLGGILTGWFTPTEAECAPPSGPGRGHSVAQQGISGCRLYDFCLAGLIFRCR
jgi:hypothetical protein